MNRSSQILVLVILAQMFFPDFSRAQQLGRLMAYNASAATCVPPPPPFQICFTVSTRFSLFEVDPGSASLIEVPINPVTLPWAPLAIGGFFGAYDDGGGRVFIYDTLVGGMLYTIDAGTGAMLHSSLVGPGLFYLHFESSTQRLLAMIASPTLPVLVEVDVVTGAITQLSAGINASLSPSGNGLATALDDAGHRLFLTSNAGGILTIDTFTGVQIGLSPVTPPVIPSLGSVWDPALGKILAFNTQGPVGLISIDPMTGIIAPVGVGFPSLAVNQVRKAHALDVQRGLYHIVGNVGSQGSALHTFDVMTGQQVADPVVMQAPLNDSILFLDSAHSAQKGRVSLSPTNILAPSVSLAVEFEAIGHGNEWYFPFVSCTPGSFSVPSSNLVLPLAFDTCTSLYSLSPASSQFFNLTPNTPGTVADLLSPAGTSLGSVMLPLFTPLGLNFDLRITFITLSQMGQWTGAHGLAIVHVIS